MNKMLKSMLLLLTAAVSFGVISAEDNCACGCENKEVATEQVQEVAQSEVAKPVVQEEEVALPVEEQVVQNDLQEIAPEVAPVQEVTAEDVK